ncbi:ATP-binding protein [Streptomyces sp. NPDC096040]|uniref:ATP-binding protein n=1 Tax=Streptomyces sp. NPDC096040 TaxID=3155541 RepID=UPI00332678AD
MGELVLRDLAPLAEVPTATRSLPRLAESVPVARHLVRKALADWQLTGLDDVAELVVTELVTNSVRHARSTTIRVTVRRLDGGKVQVAVVDMSRTMPVLLPPTEDAVDGRGLAIIDAVSVQWGTDLLPWGKRVWADLEPEQPPAGQPAPTVPIYVTPQAQALYVLIVITLGVLLALAVVSDAP